MPEQNLSSSEAHNEIRFMNQGLAPNGRRCHCQLFLWAAEAGEIGLKQKVPLEQPYDGWAKGMSAPKERPSLFRKTAGILQRELPLEGFVDYIISRLILRLDIQLQVGDEGTLFCGVEVSFCRFNQRI